MSRIARRTGFAALVIAPVIALLVACAPAPVPTPAPAPAAPSVPATPSAPASPSGTPVTFTCTEALPEGVAGWTGTASFTPATGTDAAQAVQLGGIACESTDANGDSLTFSIALPDSASLTSLETQAASAGTATSALGGQSGYFAVDNGTGLANVFAGGYWISAQSTTFGADTDAAQVMGQLITVLPAG